MSFVTQDQRRQVREALAVPSSDARDNGDGVTEEALLLPGVFYVILLEPDCDPTRLKVGFTSTLDERLRHLRCSAPYASVIRTWPCKSLWEKTAIECVTAGCERLHTEVFRADSTEHVLQRCEQFFTLMPQVEHRVGP